MLYIQNQWTSGRGKLFKSMNPLTGEIVWEGNFANASQLNAAMHAAIRVMMGGQLNQSKQE
jgi:succinylglutamic semialdehyde dehydrogenase